MDGQYLVQDFLPWGLDKASVVDLGCGRFTCFENCRTGGGAWNGKDDGMHERCGGRCYMHTGEGVELENRDRGLRREQEWRRARNG